MIYNIGDFIRSKRYRKFGWNNKINFDLEFCKEYPNSLCSKYLNRNINDTQTMDNYHDDSNINYKLLIEIVKESTIPELIPDINSAYVHLRINDAIDKLVFRPDKEFKDYTEYLNNEMIHWNKINYVKPLKYYEERVNKLKEYNIKNIILIAFNYDKDKESNSYKYTNSIKEFFINNEFNVEIRYDKNPDHDFILMCNAKYFIPSGGGYSLLIKNISLLNNNIII